MSERLPLQDLRIVVTRPAGQEQGLIAALEAKGASTIHFPTVEIEPLPDLSELDAALRALSIYHWAIFTSVNGVCLTWQRMEALGMSSRAFAGCKVAAIGPATAEALRVRGLIPAFVPEWYLGESLAEGIGEVSGRRFLLPRAMGARPTLPQILTHRGGQVDEIGIYRAVKAAPGTEALERLREPIDMVTFTSPSTVRNWVSILQEAQMDPFSMPGEPLIACIGPITAQAAMQAGCSVELVASSFTAQGLIECLLEYYAPSSTPSTLISRMDIGSALAIDKPSNDSGRGIRRESHGT